MAVSSVDRVKELSAMALIGDGVIGALQPARHAKRWLTGPKSWRRAMRAFARRPALTRSLATAEAVGGVWLARRLRAR